ncbi:WbqC family protein [Vibrio cholerae]|uniref:WbqC family protein n=1 Tax=Vibrio cholerae TaxID=666 RepID=UPI00115C1D6B|nr:WbqC family protein [Vibrio cholerae]EJL6407876.1 WbqC family protein [Vibrio cholerae]EJL6710227.1 WbqC family protein [Vibrio cholerae]EKF9878872.1 WbqC family protein [Vibrio cholerae]TQO61607.1 WbqC family protein [Vibrio cholerae]TYA69467.1 WbqC family protein [Vibrio cholerae]
MKLAIMQPYLFPYIGYFSLIIQSDEFIIFDTPQFMRKGWIERNRIGKLTGGSVYIKVPLHKADLSTKIKDMSIDNTSGWREKIISQLDVYKKRAPFYANVLVLVKDVLNTETSSIVHLNKIALEKVCDYLGVHKKLKVFSEMNLEIEPPQAPDEWALNICKALNVQCYVNAAGGESFFDKNKYANNNIQLCFINQPIEEYEQFGHDFEPGLSIIDVMMFNSPEKIIQMLSKGSLKCS